MIVTKPPFRISFFGGETDMESFLISTAMSTCGIFHDFLTTPH